MEEIAGEGKGTYVYHVVYVGGFGIPDVQLISCGYGHCCEDAVGDETDLQRRMLDNTDLLHWESQALLPMMWCRNLDSRVRENVLNSTLLQLARLTIFQDPLPFNEQPHIRPQEKHNTGNRQTHSNSDERPFIQRSRIDRPNRTRRPRVKVQKMFQQHHSACSTQKEAPARPVGSGQIDV